MARPTIRIGEDEPVIATLLTQVLKTGRYQVLDVRTGTDALAPGRLQQGEIALSGQPDRPGPDAAHRLGELRSQGRTSFTSGCSLDGWAERRLLPPKIFRDENTIYIPKPFPPKGPLDLVDSIFSMQTKVATAGIDWEGAARVRAAH